MRQGQIRRHVGTAAFAQLAAEIAIFLFGMRFMKDGFSAFTGGTLETLLKRFTKGPWRSLGFGIVATTLTQSSGLVSVITISFLSAGLIDLAAGIGFFTASPMRLASGNNSDGPPEFSTIATNSSADSRARSPKPLCRRLANTDKIRSPTKWPKLSLIALK